jgi:ABC-type sugar transport system ATPase subunit
MKELFRLENLGRGSSLHNYSLTVFEADIFCIQSPQEDSLLALAELMGGKAAPETGQFFFRGHKVEKLSEKKALAQGVYVISSEDAYPETMSVMDFLGDIRPMFTLLSHKKEGKDLEAFFHAQQIELDPATPLWKLDGIEYFKLRLLKAKKTGASLVVLHIGGVDIAGIIAEELMRMIVDMNRQGTTFLILSHFFSPVFEIATRIQYLYQGRPRKEWDRISPSVRQRLQYGDNLSDVKRGERDAKLFLGIYDYEWDPRQNIWNYLEWLRQENRDLWERMFPANLPCEGDGYVDGVAVIPRNSQNMLLENLSIGENITILARERVCYGATNIVNRRLQRKLAETVCEKFGLPRPSRTVGSLNEAQRKILSIVRFEILRPSVIFLEMPYQGVAPEHAKLIERCLYALAEKNIKVVYSSQSQEAMAADCREIWHIHHGKVQNMPPFA